MSIPDVSQKQMFVTEDRLSDSQHEPAEKNFNGWRRFYEFINPQTTFITGKKRLMTLDFLRGLAVFMMLYGHEAQTVLDQSAFGKISFDGIMVIIFGGPVALFIAYKTFFIFLSGLSNAYSFLNKCFKLTPCQMYINMFSSLGGSIVMLPLFYIWVHCSVYGTNFAKYGNISITVPFWSNFQVASIAVVYFGLAIPITHLVLIVVYSCIVLPMRGRVAHKYVTLTFLLTSLAMTIIWFFCYMPFMNVLAKSFVYTASEDMSLFSRECPGNIFGNTSDSFGKHLKHIIYRFMAGRHMQFNLQFAFCVAGFVVACIIVFFQQLKTELKEKQDMDQQEKESRYKRYRMWLHLSFVGLIALFFVLSIAVNFQVQAQVKNGQRDTYFSVKDFVSKFEPPMCMVPEYAISQLTSELFLFYMAFLMFDCSTFQTALVRAQRITYLRRFSTYSLTCFIFSQYLTAAFRSIINVDYGVQLRPILFAVYMVAYYVVVLFLHLAMESIDGKLTPDWIVWKISQFTHPNRSSNPGRLTDQHLNVCPINLAGKKLYDE